MPFEFIEAQSQEAVIKVNKWLEDYARLQAQRGERNKADYEKYVSWSRSDMS